MTIGTNIDSQGDIVLNSENKLFSNNELISAFNGALLTSGFSNIRTIYLGKSLFYTEFSDSDNSFSATFFLKNVTNSGWADKKHIKRIQVPNLLNIYPEKVSMTKDGNTIMLLGYYNFDFNPLFIAWNFYKFTVHNTVRSCYIDVEQMLEAYKRGFTQTISHQQKVWLFHPNQFETFFMKYYEMNKG